MLVEGTTDVARLSRAANIMEILNPPAIRRSVSWASTDTSQIIQELRGFLTKENYNGFELQLMPQVCARAEAYLEAAGRKLKLIQPELTPDADGGIEIDWENNNKHLTLSCRKNAGEDFISWRQRNDPYEGDKASEPLLNEMLDWLIA